MLKCIWLAGLSLLALPAWAEGLNPLELGRAPTAFKAPPELEAGASYERILRLQSRVYTPGTLPKTPTWRGTRYREIPMPQDIDRKDTLTALDFIASRAGTPKVLIKRNQIRYDRNGDGKFVGKEENLLENNEDASFGPLLLSVSWPEPDGYEGQYPVYLWRKYSNGAIRIDPNLKFDRDINQTAFAVARGGAMRGLLPENEGTLELLDDNTNGRYDELGLDGLLLGGRAQPLSPLIALAKGGVQHLKVAPSGSVALLAPYTGAVGQLDLGQGLAAPTGMAWEFFVLASPLGFFELSRLGAGKHPLPVGSYSLYEGRLQGKGLTARVEFPGQALVEIKAEQTATLPAFGAPLKVGAKVALGGLGIEVAEIRITGKGGEIYWPLHENCPTITVLEKGQKVRQEAAVWRAEGTWKDQTVEWSKDGTYDVQISYGNATWGNLTSESYPIQKGGK